MPQVYDTDSAVNEYLRRAGTEIPDVSAERVQGSVPGYVFRNYGSKRRKKKFSTFSVILMLFVFAVASVLYIGNIIAVNSLMKEINLLEREYESVRNRNEILRAEFNNRTGLEDIGTRAIERLGMRNPSEPPRWIAVDKAEVERLAREMTKQSR